MFEVIPDWMAIKMLEQERDELKQQLAEARAECERLRAAQCQWCRGGFDAGD